MPQERGRYPDTLNNNLARCSTGMYPCSSPEALEAQEHALGNVWV